MNNRMIEFERKGIVSPLAPGASYSSAPPFRNLIENNFQPKAILPQSWCNFCEEHHEESTYEVKKSAKDKIFGKRPEATITVLDFAECYTSKLLASIVSQVSSLQVSQVSHYWPQVSQASQTSYYHLTYVVSLMTSQGHLRLV
jgi:hypothetical protein